MFPAVRDALRSIGYSGWIVVEQDVLPGMGSSKRECAAQSRLPGIDRVVDDIPNNWGVRPNPRKFRQPMMGPSEASCRGRLAKEDNTGTVPHQPSGSALKLSGKAP